MKATFGAGCFWCIEHEFTKVKGVSTSVGYMGGNLKNPTYEDVCTGETGHAEVVQVEYDPSQISYCKLLDVFWNCHDPTTMNRQGPDIGTQYRSVIFYHDQEQEREARKSKEELQNSGICKNTIVTEVVPASEYYVAESYHQNYYQKCGIV